MRNADKSKEALGEEVWSRGSSEEFCEFKQPIPNLLSFGEKVKEKPTLFRYELGGVIVYNSKARIVGEPRYPEGMKKEQGYLIQNSVKKLLNNADPRGNSYSDRKAYLSLPKLLPTPDYRPEFTMEIPQNTLRFSSKFESGNLSKAIMLSDTFYLLILESESNTSCLQWYYFQVQNKKPVTITFKIINFGKYESLYNEGMKPLVKSLKSGNDWYRAGEDISYVKNSEEKTCTLTFTFRFSFENDSVFFAYSYPYTYENLCEDLEKVKEDHQDIARVNSICESLCGNSCFMVTITEDLSGYLKFYEESYYTKISGAQRKLLRKRKVRKGENDEHIEKKGVFVTARVHPGETVGSFMMQGLLQFLLGNSKEALFLRKSFVFKLIPMLNPDGVRYGKTRVSMLGVDLNRRWLDPHQILHPTIYHAKKYLQVFKEMHECLVFCDMHGHSTKRNIFFYGCNMKPTDLEQYQRNMMARVLPFMLGKKNKLVSYKDSRFRMQKAKESTARIVVYKQFNIVNSLTIEASFYGPSSLEAFRDVREDCHMKISDLYGVGKDLALACLNLVSPAALFRQLHGLSNLIRVNSGLKAKPKIESRTEKIENIYSKELWDDVVVTEVEYQSEESEGSSPSDIDEYEKNDFFIEEPEKTPEKIRPIRTVAAIKGIKKILTKSPKYEKNEPFRSPELYFKIGGITVFSFNNRAKSTENIFHKNLKVLPEKIGKIKRFSNNEKLEKTTENKSSKLILFSAEADPSKNEKSSEKLLKFENAEEKSEEKSEKNFRLRPSGGPIMEQLYKTWMRSRPSTTNKQNPRRLDTCEIPTIRIHKAKIHNSKPFA